MATDTIEDVVAGSVQERPTATEETSAEDLIFGRSDDEGDDDRWLGIADDLAGSLVSDEDVDDFFSDF